MQSGALRVRAELVDSALWAMLEYPGVAWGRMASRVGDSMRQSAATWMACLLAPCVAMAGAAPPGAATVTVRLDQHAGRASPLVFGCSLPAPGTPGADALLPELLRNRSFEKVELAGPKRMPEGWSKGRGWQLFAFGGKHVIVRSERDSDDPLVLLRRQAWLSYRLTLSARKVDGVGGLCVLFDVQDTRNHVRWTLGANGNRQHVLESVGGGAPRLLAAPVPGRVETGRCYRIDVALRRGVLQCSLDGRLVHQVGDTGFPHAGIGLGATDSTAEYFGIAVHEPRDKPLFLLDNPSAANVDTIASDWAPLRAAGNRVGFTWDPTYPFNSHYSQCIRVETHEGGDAGICQGRIPISAGEAYRGRLYLRGAGKAPVAVSLRARGGGKVYATQTLGELAGTWGPHDFVLKPSESDPEADFCITVGGMATLWVDQASLAAEGSRTPWGLRSDVVATLRALRPTALCWPCGPGATHYNWRRGIGPADTRPVASITHGSASAFEPAANDFGTDEFLGLCNELGAEPAIALNPRLGTQALLELLAYCNAAPGTPQAAERAAHGRREPYGVRFWLLGTERFHEVGGQAYPVALAEAAREMRGFRPTPQLIALGGPLLASAEDDAKEAKQAGPMVGHIAKQLVSGEGTDAAPDLPSAVAAAAKLFRVQALDLALLDWNLSRDASSSAQGVGLLLNALSRDGGPNAMAMFRCTPPRGPASRAGIVDLVCGQAAASPPQVVWALFRSQPIGELLQVRASSPDGAEPPLDVLAGRDGDRVVIRLVSRVEQEMLVRCRFDGLGNRRLAARADHLAMPAGAGEPAAPWSRTNLAVQGGELTVPIQAGQVAHVIVLRLEGG